MASAGSEEIINLSIENDKGENFDLKNFISVSPASCKSFFKFSSFSELMSYPSEKSVKRVFMMQLYNILNLNVSHENVHP